LFPHHEQQALFQEKKQEPPRTGGLHIPEKDRVHCNKRNR
jgi:hypothetical protein